MSRQQPKTDKPTPTHPRGGFFRAIFEAVFRYPIVTSTVAMFMVGGITRYTGSLSDENIIRFLGVGLVSLFTNESLHIGRGNLYSTNVALTLESPTPNTEHEEKKDDPPVSNTNEQLSPESDRRNELESGEEKREAVKEHEKEAARTSLTVPKLQSSSHPQSPQKSAEDKERDEKSRQRREESGNISSTNPYRLTSSSQKNSSSEEEDESKTYAPVSFT